VVAKKRASGKVNVTAKNPVKRRSAAAALASARYRKRVVKSAKLYRRKGKTPLGQENDEQNGER
jgi:NAD dependent epimerase/dehydratase family enzyme